jgi:glycosyltransferase involved in cell wall biosynthesis
MRVVVAHNAYQHRGGEDVVVESEVSMLRNAGHEVETYFRSNHDLANMSAAQAAVQTVWSKRSAAAVKDLLKRFRPDVVHVHNTFPLISPSIYWTCAEAAVPVVQTLHNFRLLCPQAMLLREGRICEDCVGRTPIPAVRHGCYRGSPAQSAVVVGMLAAHRQIGTWQNKISRYIALNEFCRQKFIDGGLPSARIVVKPNFVPEVPALGNEERQSHFLFVGRLSPEKGLRCLATAVAAAADVRVRVVGVGAEGPELARHPAFEMMGELPGSAVIAEMRAAKALVVPSIWNEMFGLVTVEAFANGLPVIASRIGALANIVRDGETGLLFEPGDSGELAAKLKWASQHPQEMLRMGKRARAEYEARYTPQRNLHQLLAIYADAAADLSLR